MILCVGLSPALGRVITLPRLELGTVNRSTDYLEVAAGKACNAARVICQLGHDATLVSPIGGRSLERYRQLAHGDGVRLRAVPYPGAVRWAITLVDPVHGATEVVVGEPEPVPDTVADELISTVEGEATGAIACLIAGSRLAEIPPRVVTAVVECAQSNGTPLFLDIRGDDLAAALGAMRPGTCAVTVKINEEEFASSVAGEVTSDDQRADSSAGSDFDLCGAVASFARRHKGNVVITRGALPVIYADPAGGARSCPVPKVDAVNPIGSGDTFLAALAVRLVEGNALDDAVDAAAQCASRNAVLLRPGTIQTP